MRKKTIKKITLENIVIPYEDFIDGRDEPEHLFIEISNNGFNEFMEPVKQKDKTVFYKSFKKHNVNNSIITLLLTGFISKDRKPIMSKVLHSLNQLADKQSGSFVFMIGKSPRMEITFDYIIPNMILSSEEGLYIKETEICSCHIFVNFKLRNSHLIRIGDIYLDDEYLKFTIERLGTYIINEYYKISQDLLTKKTI